MPHRLSAAKRLRQSQKRRARNRANQSVLRKELKAFEKAVQGSPADAGKAFADVQKALDRAARKNAIPKGRADRKKARLAAFIARAKVAAAAKPAAEQAATPAG